MVLTDEDIAKFQTLYKDKFGIEISREDAYTKGIKLLRLMSIAYKPITMNEYNQIRDHREKTFKLLQTEL